MNKNALHFIITLFIFNNIVGQISSFSLECSLKNDYSGYIYLEYEDKLDSCLIVNNRFSFNGSLKNEVSSASFKIKGKLRNFPDFYLENKKIQLEMNIEGKKDKNYTRFTILSVKGTKTILIQKDFENFINKHKSEKDYYHLLLDKLDNVVTQNPKNPYLVSTVFILSKNDLIDKNQLRNIYSKLDKKIQSKFYLTRIEQNLYPEKHIKINDLVVEINLPDVNNQLFSTKSLLNKWYLIDFWASWCGPCKKQFPELKRIYSLYENKKFEIIGVSIDEDKQKWVDILDKEKFEWINVIENEGWYGTTARKYNINSIPMNFLVNPEGKVVSKNISLKELEIFLNTL